MLTRCQRLNKDCQPSEATRRRNAISKKPATKVDRLEEKLDGLVTLLKSAAQPTPLINNNGFMPTAAAQDQLTPESLQSRETTYEDAEPRVLESADVDKEKDFRPCPGGLSLHVPVISPETFYTASGTRSKTYHCPDSELCQLEPSAEEAEMYFVDYQEFKSPFFPVIIFPPSMTAIQLRRECPFVWLSIMAISSKSSEQQKTLSREIRLTIGREMLVEGKNNLDLLIGLLIYVAWHVFRLSCR